MIGRLAGDKELLMPLTFNLNSAVEAGFHWETGGIKKCRILRVSGLRIWRYAFQILKGEPRASHSS